MNNKVIVLAVSLLVLAGVSIGIVAFTLKFALGRHIIPDYPARNASLREIMDHYQKELARQGMYIQIRVMDETDYDEPRNVRGIGGNGYIFLFCVSKVFDTDFECGVWRTITIGGVRSKAGKGRRFHEGL